MARATKSPIEKALAASDKFLAKLNKRIAKVESKLEKLMSKKPAKKKKVKKGEE